MEDVFFELIQVALGTRKYLSRVPNEQEWKVLAALCEKQSISSIVFQALEGLGSYGQTPPLTILYEWIGYANKIENLNRVVNQQCVELVYQLQHDGFQCCILKGQGNAMMYPNPMLRMPGDIDIWLLPKSDKRCKKSEIRKIIRYVKERNPKGEALYHHVDYGDYHGIEVEVHYRPSFMFSPINNRRLQKWFMTHSPGVMADLPDGVGAIPVPDWEFNVIFQLSHIYNHVLHEGIGLRQIIDYYFLLLTGNNNQFRDESLELRDTLRYLGLEKIARALMWVIGFIVHSERFMVDSTLERGWMICEPDERKGKLLLTEIMKGGNFGQYDTKNLRVNSAIKKNIQRLKRDMKLLRYFPSECMWEPVFRVYHFFWRLRYNYSDCR